MIKGGGWSERGQEIDLDGWIEGRTEGCVPADDDESCPDCP